jgi:hypothetical protein
MTAILAAECRPSTQSCAPEPILAIYRAIRMTGPSGIRVWLPIGGKYSCFAFSAPLRARSKQKPESPSLRGTANMKASPPWDGSRAGDAPTHPRLVERHYFYTSDIAPSTGHVLRSLRELISRTRACPSIRSRSAPTAIFEGQPAQTPEMEKSFQKTDSSSAVAKRTWLPRLAAPRPQTGMSHKSTNIARCRFAVQIVIEKVIISFHEYYTASSTIRTCEGQN